MSPAQASPVFALLLALGCHRALPPDTARLHGTLAFAVGSGTSESRGPLVGVTLQEPAGACQGIAEIGDGQSAAFVRAIAPEGKAATPGRYPVAPADPNRPPESGASVALFHRDPGSRHLDVWISSAGWVEITSLSDAGSQGRFDVELTQTAHTPDGGLQLELRAGASELSGEFNLPACPAIHRLQ